MLGISKIETAELFSIDRPLAIDVSAIDAMVDDLDLGLGDGPGACIGLVAAGSAPYRRAIGFADIEAGERLTSATGMRIQSVTKHFTCLAYLLLCDDGRASLDERLADLLPDIKSQTAGKVTARQLMTHTSGLWDSHDIRYQFSGIGDEVRTEDLASFYDGLEASNFTPGTSWSYNNGAYSLLTLVIERLSGVSLEDFLTTRIFGPSGMRSTYLQRLENGDIDRAVNYTKAANGFERAPPVGSLAGNGGIVSTLDDMLVWLTNLLNPRVGTPETWQLMRSPIVLPSNQSTDYGLGLMLAEYRGLEYFGHAGGTIGGNTIMLVFPALALGIQVMVNRDDISAMDIAYRIIDATVRNLQPLRNKNQRTRQGLFGPSASGRIIQLQNIGGRPQAIVDGSVVTLVAGEGEGLHPTPNLSFYKYAFHVDKQDSKTLLFSDFGHVERLRKIPAGCCDVSDSIEGNFRAREIDVDATIGCDGPTPIMDCHGQFGSTRLNLKPLSEVIFHAFPTQVMQSGAILRFDASGCGFVYSNIRNQNIYFERQDV